MGIINSILKLSYKDTPSYAFTYLWPDQSYAMEVKHGQQENKIPTELQLVK
jgi:hypothetical protein